MERSWVAAANEPGCGFGLENLPYCAFEARDGEVHLGVGIGKKIFDLDGAAKCGLLDGVAGDIRDACLQPTLNGVMGCGKAAGLELRGRLRELLADRGESEALRGLLRPMEGATFRRPVDVGNYTDFYTSIHHATNVGRMFRPKQPLTANYKHLPIGYHGRASSVVVSGTPVVRPEGQLGSGVFGPSRMLDWEVELGAYVGVNNALGEPVSITEAEERLFGVTLVNDWSARDIQSWEYQPLGPFLGKSFATSVGAWVVPMEALEPYRVPMAEHGAGDPEVLPYLRSAGLDGLDVWLEVWLRTAEMRRRGLEAVRVSRANFREQYWSFRQMVAHHTSNGCNLQVGDLIASGTVSGEERGSWGSLLEVTQRGTEPLALPSGETRRFLEDGDEVVLTGRCEREGLPSIALGCCGGTIVPRPAGLSG